MRRVLSLSLLALVVVGLVWLSRSARLVPGATGGDVADATADAPPASENARARADLPAPELRAEEAREPRQATTAPSPSAPFAGRLIDASTGEAVPWYALELSDPEANELRVTSDGDGRFTTDGTLVPGLVRIELVDVDGQPAATSTGSPSVLVKHEVGGPASDVRIDVGPTYFLDVTLPPARIHADLRVRLFTDPPELAAEPLEEETGETRLRAPCGDSPFAWARFRATNPGRKKPQWLQVSTDDELWVGGARVPSGPGVHREPVRVTLSSACAVRGRFVSTVPDPPGHGALALFREGAELEPRWESTDGEGRFRISGITPGAYRLEVRDERVRAEPVRFAVRSGERDLGELPWTPIPLAGKVLLRVQSEVELPIDVELVRRFDAPRYPPWHGDEWEPLPGGGFESRFEWDEVHAGALEVVVHSHGLGEWHLSLGELEPPVADLVLRLPPPPPVLVFSVVDDATGEALDTWSVLVRGERGWEEPDGSPESLRFAVWDEDTAFAVCSPGYRAWLASPGAPGFPASPEGRIEVRLRLRRGWSHLFLARKRPWKHALEGVEIRLDGRSAGRTDARGELWVHADAPARELEVAHPTLLWTDEDPLDDVVSWLALHR